MITMAKHVCYKEAELAEIHSMVKSIYREMKGNGQPGLIQRFNRMEGWNAAIKWFVGPGVLVSLILALLTFFGVKG